MKDKEYCCRIVNFWYHYCVLAAGRDRERFLSTYCLPNELS